MSTNTFSRWAYAHGLSAEMLAERLGYSPVYVLSLLLGRQPINARFAGRFLRVFGVEAAADALGIGDGAKAHILPDREVTG